MWRYKWVIVVSALLGGAVGYGISTLQETVYQADGSVLLNDARSSAAIAIEIGLVLDTRRHAQIMDSPQVAQRAAEILADGSTANQVQNSTAATPVIDLNAITVTATAQSASATVGLVNAVVAAHEEVVASQIQTLADASIATLEASVSDTERRLVELDGLVAENPDDSALEAQRIAAVNQLVALDTRIESLNTNIALYGSGVQLYVPPDTPTGPVQPRPARTAAFVGILAALLSGAWAWRRADRRQIASDAKTPSEVLEAPLLAAVPEYRAGESKWPSRTFRPRPSHANGEYQFAMASLGFGLESIGGRSVLITSAREGDGKTSTALNLAIAATRDGRDPLLIDADARARGLTRLSGLEDELGVSNLDAPDTAPRSIHPWELADGTVIDFVPAGTSVAVNTSSFFRSSEFQAAFDELLKGRDMVIIDSPPLLAASEAVDIAAAVDAVVLIVSRGSLLDEVSKAKQRISLSGTPLVGYIFNRAIKRSVVGIADMVRSTTRNPKRQNELNLP